MAWVAMSGASIVQRKISGLLTVADAFVRKNPMSTAVILTGGKSAAADALVQWSEGHRLGPNATTPWDWRRSALFAAFGAGYQGGSQFIIFNRILERLWPGKEAGQVACKVLAANCICDPVLFFPTFYTLKELADPNTPILASITDPVGTVSTALGKYSENYLQDWKNSWMFWLPGHIISFGVMPTHLRFPWMASVSFGYCCALSYTRGQVLMEQNESPLHAVGIDNRFGSRKLEEGEGGINPLVDRDITTTKRVTLPAMFDVQYQREESQLESAVVYASRIHSEAPSSGIDT